jgi:hypothetical protein
VLVNFGVLVHIPQPHGDDATGSLRNERFRLAYLFAPLYRLPLRLGRSINLSSVLAAPPPPPVDQLGLLEDGER